MMLFMLVYCRYADTLMPRHVTTCRVYFHAAMLLISLAIHDAVIATFFVILLRYAATLDTTDAMHMLC